MTPEDYARVELVREASLSIEQQAALVRAVLHFAERAHIAEAALATIASETTTAHRLLHGGAPYAWLPKRPADGR